MGTFSGEKEPVFRRMREECQRNKSQVISEVIAAGNVEATGSKCLEQEMCDNWGELGRRKANEDSSVRKKSVWSGAGARSWSWIRAS